MDRLNAAVRLSAVDVFMRLYWSDSDVENIRNTWKSICSRHFKTK